MIDHSKLRELADASDGNGEALFEVGNELIGAQYRIDRTVGSLRQGLDGIELAMQRGRETDGLNGLNGNDVAVLLESLGERNALLRTMRRLGVDPTQF